MNASPTANATARRNLIQRINRFYDRLMKGDFQPTTDQLVNLDQALAALDQGTYSVGEDAMTLVEKGWKPRHSPVNPPKSRAELIKNFERLLADEQ